jgi:hypothetical protein
VTRPFRSHVYGRMHKRRRRELGLGGFPREETWARMAEEERRIAVARWWAGLTWWQRMWHRVLAWLRRAANRMRRR